LSAIKKAALECHPSRVATTAVPVKIQSQNQKQQNQRKIHQKLRKKMNLGNQLTDRQQVMKKPSAVAAEIAAETVSIEDVAVMTTGVKEVETMVGETGVLSGILHQGTGIPTPASWTGVAQCMKDCRKSHLNALIDQNQV